MTISKKFKTARNYCLAGWYPASSGGCIAQHHNKSSCAMDARLAKFSCSPRSSGWEKPPAWDTRKNHGLLIEHDLEPNEHLINDKLLKDGTSLLGTHSISHQKATLPGAGGTACGGTLRQQTGVANAAGIVGRAKGGLPVECGQIKTGIQGSWRPTKLVIFCILFSGFRLFFCCFNRMLLWVFCVTWNQVCFLKSLFGTTTLLPSQWRLTWY